MKTETGIDEELLAEAKELSGISDTRTVVEEALRKLIRALELRAERQAQRAENADAHLKLPVE